MHMNIMSLAKENWEQENNKTKYLFMVTNSFIALKATN